MKIDKLILIFLLIFYFCNCKEKSNKTQISNAEYNRIKNMIAELRFINYDDVINNLSFANTGDSMIENVDYSKILILDSAKIKEINKIASKAVDELKSYSVPYSVTKENSSSQKNIETEFTSLSECFTDEATLKEILMNNFSGYRLNSVWLSNDIYVKGDSVAVFSLGERQSLQTNKIFLINGYLIIRHIYTLMAG